MKPTDTAFIMCKDQNCFPEHHFVIMAEHVRMCSKLMEYVGKINRD